MKLVLEWCGKIQQSDLWSRKPNIYLMTQKQIELVFWMMWKNPTKRIINTYFMTQMELVWWMMGKIKIPNFQGHIVDDISQCQNNNAFLTKKWYNFKCQIIALFYQTTSAYLLISIQTYIVSSLFSSSFPSSSSSSSSYCYVLRATCYERLIWQKKTKLYLLKFYVKSYFCDHFYIEPVWKGYQTFLCL